VDYEHLTASDRLTLKIIKENGSCEQIDLEKEDYEPLGLSFATSLMDNMRTCKNHCVFCFIDQMPKGGRSSLHVKDDDWRMSFVMGNYVTLTNLDERELDRVIRRRVSPLYISLHASDPEVRRAMMKNPHAGDILPQLKRLADAGLQFHLQIVLCPGLNDGDVLRRSIDDMLLLYPRARSLAVVPVGLTRHRDKLYPLRTFTREEAEATIDEIEARQAELLREHGTRFVFLADEWYTLCGRSLPAYDAYEGFPQIENGVGLLRLFEGDMLEALEEKKPLKRAKRFLVAGGTSAQAFFAESYRQLLPYHITLDVRAIRNRFFGESVTVGGLITGGDLVEQLMGEDFGRALLIPRAMLKADEELFLDGMRKSEAEKKLGTRIIPVASGDHLVEIIFSE
jgi:putative radical SAM enzyme (TIGR03279 family)